jgi:hypothetical protein
MVAPIQSRLGDLRHRAGQPDKALDYIEQGLAYLKDNEFSGAAAYAC